MIPNEPQKTGPIIQEGGILRSVRQASKAAVAGDLIKGSGYR
jgi:hypothetical protein